MKITLQFDDVNEAKDAINGGTYKMILWNIDQKLRNDIRRNNSMTEEQIQYAESIREFLRSELTDWDVSIEG
jgi:hypothetical protein